MPAYCQRYSPAHDFGKSEFSVTLSGVQWLALTTKLQGDPLSPGAYLIATQAAETLRSQVIAASTRAAIVNHR